MCRRVHKDEEIRHKSMKSFGINWMTVSAFMAKNCSEKCLCFFKSCGFGTSFLSRLSFALFWTSDYNREYNNKRILAQCFFIGLSVQWYFIGLSPINATLGQYSLVIKILTPWLRQGSISCRRIRSVLTSQFQYFCITVLILCNQRTHNREYNILII